MNDAKYIGLDVHQATIPVVVLDASGKLVLALPDDWSRSTHMQRFSTAQPCGATSRK